MEVELVSEVSEDTCCNSFRMNADGRFCVDIMLMAIDIIIEIRRYN